MLARDGLSVSAKIAIDEEVKINFFFPIPEQREGPKIRHAALLVHQILRDILRTTRHRESQHLRRDVNAIGQFPPLACPSPALVRRRIRRLDEQAHQGEIAPLDGYPDRECVPPTGRRAVAEQEAYEGYRAGGRGAR